MSEVRRLKTHSFIDLKVLYAYRQILGCFLCCFFFLIGGLKAENNSSQFTASFFSAAIHSLKIEILHTARDGQVIYYESTNDQLVKNRIEQLKSIIPTFTPSVFATTDCPDIEIIDLRNVVGFSQLDDLNICGDADTLSLIIFTGDLGEVKGFELKIDFPDGLIYAGWEYAQLGNTNIIATKPKKDKTEFFVDGITGDSLVIVNIGVEANCEVDKTVPLFIDFSYEYTYVDTSGMTHSCEETYRPDLEVNSAIHESVLNMLSPLVPEEISITTLGEPVCQQIQISQDGLNAYLDSFQFDIEGLDFNAGEIILDSVTANGVKIPLEDISFDIATNTSTFNLNSIHFLTNTFSNPADGRINTNEIITVEICYRVDECPSATELPFKYKAYFGCDDQICETSSQTSFISIQPIGALMPLASVSLVTGGAQICGTPATVNLTLSNPNTDTEQHLYSDLKIGFQTCEKPNLDITAVTIGVTVLPDSLYEWVGDDINIDFSRNKNAGIGLEDYDNDGFYDDLRGGQSITAAISIGVVCGLEAAEECTVIECKDVQFYVDAVTNCNVPFKDFPTPDKFNLVYGATSVSNPTEAQFGTTGVFGYDFGTYSNTGAPIATDSSSLEVTFCYTFEKENIDDCSVGATNTLEVLFAGDPHYSQDVEFIPNSDSLSIDGGATYTIIGGATMSYPDENSALLTINGGSDATSVCYKYSIFMDSCICSPVGYITAQQQVVSDCTSCTGGCEILKACRTATFRVDPDCEDCDCYVQNRNVRTERTNFGYTDKSRTTKHTRQSLIDAGGTIDLTRFLPGDTLIHEDYFVILDTAALLNISNWRINWNFFENGSTSWTDVEKLDLALDGHNSILDHFSISNTGGSRNDVDLSALEGCLTDNNTIYGGVWSYFDKTPWGESIDYVNNHNSSADYADNNGVYLYLWNYDKVEDCGGDNAYFSGGNCLDELIATYNVKVGDTLHFTWRAPLIINPNRAALKAKGVAPTATNIARIYPQFYIYGHDTIAGESAYCASYIGAACVEFSPIHLDIAGEIDAVTRMDLTDCGGTVVHEFTVNDLPGPLGDPWFTKEYRPFMNLKDVKGMVRAPLAYCANSKVNKLGEMYDVKVDSTVNLFCNSVIGYSDSLCAVDTLDVGAIIFDLYEQGIPALGIGLDNCDTIKLSYDLCMVCPADIVGISEYTLVYDWSYVGTPIEKESANHTQYRCNQEDREERSICDEYDLPVNAYYWEELGLDSLMNKTARVSEVFILNDLRDPLAPLVITNQSPNLIASESPTISEEIQRIKICNSDIDDMATGVGASVTIPTSVKLVNVYSDTTGTPSTLTYSLVSETTDGKTYNVMLLSGTLAANECDSFYVGTTLLYCPDPDDFPPTICVGAFSGCASAEVKAALAASDGCGEIEVCYAYVSGEVGLQTEWFDPPSNPTLCDTVIFNVRVKNVKQLVLLDLEPMFDLPAGITPLSGSWEVSYPGGEVAPLNWQPIGSNPDVISGTTYAYSDDALWSSKINLDGLQGVNSVNATLDSNKVAFRFKAISACDQFLSGSKLQTETTAADPCTDVRVTSGQVESAGVIINGADPEDYAQLILVADPDNLNCQGTINTFKITALNTGNKSTSDSVLMCITLPSDLEYMNGSLIFANPTGFIPNDVTQTVIGDELELCFNAPAIGAYGSISINFDAAMEESAACGSMQIGTDVKSYVDAVTCDSGPPINCGVFVQNSLNNSVTVKLNAPFIAEDIAVYTDCANDPDSVDLYFEYIINHNGPDALNQPYTVNFYEDVDGDQILNANIDNLIGTTASIFSVVDGATIELSGMITVNADQSCPVLFEVIYDTDCACDRSSEYFDKIKIKGLSVYQDPITMCVNSCFDIIVCDFVTVRADSITGATGVPYVLEIDWLGLDKYTLPVPGLNNDSTNYESMTDNSIGNGNRNALFSEPSYADDNGYLVAHYDYPVAVSSVFIGGGYITGWGNATQIPVYTSTAYCLEYSHNNIDWTNSELVFNGADDHAIEEHELPTSLAAQHWRMSSCGAPTNWATSEFRLEGEGLPFQSNPPISRVGNTITICLPDGVGETEAWEIDFTTGTGQCSVTETLEIWKSGTPAFTIEGDTVVCGTECIDMEVIVPNDAINGMTVSWSFASLLDAPTAFEVTACNLSTDVTFEATITYNEGDCQDIIQWPVKYYPINSINMIGANIIDCYNPYIRPILTADLGWDLYTWYEISTGSEILAYSSVNNVFIPLEGGTYIVKANKDGTTCPAISTSLMIPTTTCQHDFGDLPDNASGTSTDNYETSLANNGPNHVINPAIFLGPTIDAEIDGNPTIDAFGDGIDEDGLMIFSSLDLTPNKTFRLPLSATNTTGETAYLKAWIDWNGDGAFNDAEELVLTINDDSGFPLYLETTVPTNAPLGSLLGVRIRLSNTDGMTPYGPINEGEIEDYLLGVACPQVNCLPIELEIKRE